MSSSLSSSLPRPYIGSCRNRNYISNRPFSFLSNDYSFRSLKSLLPRPFRSMKNSFSHQFTFDAFEERFPINYGSSTIARQLNQEQRPIGFQHSSSSSSLFLLPTPNHSHSFSREQQRFHQSYPSEQAKHFPTYSSLTSLDDHHTPTSRLMSSSRANKIHAYDQRVSDQGNKYIIQLKTDDYQEDEFILTPRAAQNQLIIDAKHHEEDCSGGFIRRELHKIFLIPKHIDINKYTYSYNQYTQELTVEMPYVQSNTTEPSFHLPASQNLTFSYGNLNLTNAGPLLSDPSNRNPSTNDVSMKPFDFDSFHRSAFRPQIIPTSGNENKLLMSLDLSDYQPEDIKISIQNQELIVRAERNVQTDTRKSRKSFFQSTTLPPQTDIERLQSNYIDGKLIIEAPYLDRRKKTHE